MARTDTRCELIKIGAEIISHQGFNSTGIDAVLKKAQIPKGSFYYYFTSKEDFGLAVIEQLETEYLDKLDTLFKDKKLAPLQRLRKYFDYNIENLEKTKCSRGCPFGNLGQEMAGQHEKFRLRLDSVFEKWKQRLVDCLSEAKKQKQIRANADVEQLADFLMTGLEGAMLRSKVAKSAKPMRDFVEIALTRLLN